MTSMEKLLQEKNCYLEDQMQDWKKAAHTAYEPLIEQNYYTTAYEDAIYEVTERLGPYYVPREGLALIHVSNRPGVNDMQMAVTVFKGPMKLEPDGYDVRVLVAPVVKDSESHMKGTQAISNIFPDEKRIQKILDATCPKEIFDLLVSSTCEK